MTIRRRVGLLLAAVLLLALGLGGFRLRACFGPDTSIVFTWERHPDLPLERFAAGRLGVLQPFYARSYLVVAYRYLTSQPLTLAEQTEAVDLWLRRLNGHQGIGSGWDQPEALPGVHYLETPAPEEESGQEGSVEAWQKARSELVQGPPPPKSPGEARWNRFQWFENFQRDGFRTALWTLRDRVERWGRHDPRTKAWIQAQDMVFASRRERPLIPSLLGATADPLLRQDRSYQVASAKFYAQHYDAALKDYETIAGDTNSPWGKTAAYMVARCWYRKALALEAEGPEHAHVAREAFSKALDAAQKVQEHPKAFVLAMALRWEAKGRSLRQQAGDSSGFDLAAHLLAKAAAAGAHPVERIRELAALLAKPGGTSDFGVDLGDFTILMDRQIQGEQRWDSFRHHEFPWRTAPEEPRTIPAELLKDDLTDWVYSFRETGPEAYRHSREIWSRQKSVPWLVSALASAEPQSPGLDALLQSATALPEAHPGFPMVAFHRARILLATGRAEDARSVLDRLVQLGEGQLGPSGLNLVRALRLPLSRTREELIGNLLRNTVGVDYPEGEGTHEFLDADSDLRLVAQWSVAPEHAKGRQFFRAYGPNPAFLQADGAAMLNAKIPTSLLADLARSPRVPPHLRREWLRCAWVRSVLLEDLTTAVALAPEVQETEPEMREPLMEFLAAPEQERTRAAVWILLHHPGLRWFVGQSVNARTYLPTRKAQGDYDWQRGYRLKDRHPFRDSFWPTQKDLETNRNQGFWFGGTAPFAEDFPLGSVLQGRKQSLLDFLTAAERAQADRESRRLQDLDDGPTWLCKRVLAWAKASPRDPRLPEALHYSIRATRIGGATELSKSCFQVLHTRYEKTAWAQRTPYYF